MQAFAAGGKQTYYGIVTFDPLTNTFVPVAIDLNSAEQVYLVLYGTGWRARSALSAVTVTVGGTPASINFAGAVPGFVGLDQLNIQLPRSLIGRGDANVVVTVDGKVANTVTVKIK